jgi:DeoR family transcriptional regulator of aga operon
MEILQQRGSASVVALAEQLNVSEVTIRKDLTLLEEKQMLYRAHGSAILMNPYINDRPINEKEKHNAVEKRAIGIQAASLIKPDDSILIASGTTMLYLAREIKAQGRLTVITSAINIVPILTRDRNVDVVQLGGMVRNTSVSAVGVYAERMLEDFSCSKLFLGVDGIDLDYGLSTTNLMEASLNRAMIRAAQKTILLVDSSKFGRRGFSKICDLDEVDQIITDSRISPHILEQLHSRGIEVTVVPV